MHCVNRNGEHAVSKWNVRNSYYVERIKDIYISSPTDTIPVLELRLICFLHFPSDSTYVMWLW
jgi:hypothetical protein